MLDTEISRRQQQSLSAAMTEVLDMIRPPVARLRLMSLGLSPALRTESFKDVVGDKGCLTCGNCSDVCPVMRWQFGAVIVPNMRTSMALERFVDDKCRRCYACIRSCPQIDRGLKEFALTFRRGEKIAHGIFVAAFLTLFSTGLILNHFRDDLSQIIVTLLGWIHRTAVPVLILGLLAYFLLDRHHLVRRLRQITTWGREDIEWLKKDWRALRSKGQMDFPTYGEVHPGRKFWQLYLIVALPIFGVSGTGLWIGEATLGTSLFTFFRWTHIVTAVGADIMVLLHVIRVLIRPVWQRLRRMAAVFGKESELLVERAQFLG